MMKQIFLSSILYLLLSLLIPEVYAGNQSKVIIRTVDLDSKWSSIYLEAANMIARESGLQFENKVLPYSRVVRGLKNGDVQLSILFRKTNLDQFIIPIAPLFKKEVIIVGKKDTQINSLTELNGKLVGNVRGAKYGKDFDDNSLIKKYWTKNYSQSVKMLMAGHLDYIIGTKESLFIIIKKLGFSEDQLGKGLAIGSQSSWLQLSKKKTEGISVEKLKETCQKLSRKGYFKNLIKNYNK
jgi:polar amino acid transport system substrate-binding protein